MSCMGGRGLPDQDLFCYFLLLCLGEKPGFVFIVI